MYQAVQTGCKRLYHCNDSRQLRLSRQVCLDPGTVVSISVLDIDLVQDEDAYRLCMASAESADDMARTSLKTISSESALTSINIVLAPLEAQPRASIRPMPLAASVSPNKSTLRSRTCSGDGNEPARDIEKVANLQVTGLHFPTFYWTRAALVALAETRRLGFRGLIEHDERSMRICSRRLQKIPHSYYCRHTV